MWGLCNAVESVAPAFASAATLNLCAKCLVDDLSDRLRDRMHLVAESGVSQDDVFSYAHGAASPSVVVTEVVMVRTTSFVALIVNEPLYCHGSPYKLLFKFTPAA